MIMMIGNGVAIFCNVGQEVRSKELEQLQSARHRQAKFKLNIQNIEKVHVCQVWGREGVVLLVLVQLLHV